MLFLVLFGFASFFLIFFFFIETYTFINYRFCEPLEFEVAFFIRLLSHVKNEDLLMISLAFLQTPISSAPFLLNNKKNTAVT